MIEFDPALIYRFTLLVVLLIASAFFAGTEVALFSLTRIHIDRIKGRKPKIGARIEKLLSRPQRLLVTIYIGNELTNVAISAVITVIALDLFGSTGLAIAVGIGAFLLLVFGEITPKTYAHYHNETWASVAALPLTIFMRVIWPVREGVTIIAGAIVRLFGGTADIEQVVTEDELLTLVEEGADEGIIDQDEKEMIQGVFDLGDLSVSDVMTPRTDILSIDIDTNLKDAWDQVAASPFARAPVYKGSIDKVVGVLFKKDLLKLDYPPPTDVTLQSLVREPFIVPETITANELLREFKRRKTHLAIAMDEYGGVAGLVTLDDVIDELVTSGQEENENSKVRRVGEKSWRIPGSMKLVDFNERFGVNFSHEDIETISGIVFHHIGRAPAIGDSVSFENIHFKVDQIDGRRIKRIVAAFSYDDRNKTEEDK